MVQSQEWITTWEFDGRSYEDVALLAGTIVKAHRAAERPRPAQVSNGGSRFAVSWFEDVASGRRDLLVQLDPLQCVATDPADSARLTALTRDAKPHFERLPLLTTKAPGEADRALTSALEQMLRETSERLAELRAKQASDAARQLVAD
jgi:hypothetical protein